MFFGHKCAPLVMCRLSALLSRLLQGMFWQAELQLATYIDDPLTVLVGSRRRRNRNLSLALLTLGALGIHLAWHKGASRTHIVWIGVQFTLRWREGVLENEIPGEVAQGAPREAREVWASGGMAPLAALRSFAGKLSWAAGIYKRARWTVSMIYGAIAAHEAEVKTGLEEARRQTRKDNRPKEFMVPIKRFEMAQGLACHFAQGEAPENLHDVVEEARIHHDRHGCLPPGVRRPPVGEGRPFTHAWQDQRSCRLAVETRDPGRTTGARRSRRPTKEAPEERFFSWPQPVARRLRGGSDLGCP